LIVVHESAAARGISKPVICPKCKRGRLGSIPEWSRASISHRGNPPPWERGDCVQVKCLVCGSFWSLTIE